MLRKFLSITLFSCLIPLWTHASSIPLVTEILSREPKSKESGPHIVFDIDDTMCKRVKFAGLNREEVQRRLPNSMVIPFVMPDQSLANHVMYPDYGEVFLVLLSWGWHISFFSAGESIRNDMVIPTYLKYALAPYCQDPVTEIPKLMERISIYSKNHMKTDRELARENHQYEAGGNKKKDLRIASKDIMNCILVDDDKSYALGGDQYPCLIGHLPMGLDDYYSKLNNTISFRPEYCLNFKSGIAYVDGHYPQRDIASYQLGIFLECKGLMAQENINLRPALIRVITALDKDPDDIKRSGPCIQSSWDLEHGPSAEAMQSKFSSWVKNGQDAIQNIIRQRSESYQHPDIYECVAKEVYGTLDIYSLKEDDGCIIQ